jgi:type III pantothenate kinase
VGQLLRRRAASFSFGLIGNHLARDAGIGCKDGLFQRAARLPRVEVRNPGKTIGHSTVTSIQSGLYFGYLSLVDGMIDRIVAEVGGKPRVIATGGLAELFGSGSQRIEEIDPLLTLKGLRLIDERNRGG